MIFAALDEAAARGELLLVDGGFCRFHRRRDGVVTVREIFVLPQVRRKGVGRALLAEVLARSSGAVLRARCPLPYESNGFWKAMGFTLAGEKDGVNTWQRPSQG